MVNKDILGGLKVALSRGDSLQSAMQSFYNAGYTKEEIEEAARALTSEISQQQYYLKQNIPQQMQQPQKRQVLLPKPTQLLQPSQGQRPQQVIKPQPQQQPLQPKPTTIQQLPPKKPQESQQQAPQIKYVPPQLPQKQEEIQATRQIVSNYAEEGSKYTVDFITIMLITILLILLGILAAVFFFKPQLVEFLNKFLD